MLTHLGGVRLVVEEDDLEILDVVHGELVEARGEEVAGLKTYKLNRRTPPSRKQTNKDKRNMPHHVTSAHSQHHPILRTAFSCP